jgi:hypothetical protein
LLDAHQLAHAHPSGSSADIIAGQILPFAPEPIGAAWSHQDGKGFNVKFDYLPLNGAEIVIREPRTEGDR